jgi:hypothetical protein
LANYWKQSTVASAANGGCAWSWQDLSIPVGESITVGLIFQSGVIQDKPVLTMYETNLNLDLLLMSGTISNALSCSLYVLLDDDLSRLVLVGMGLGSSFSVYFRLPEAIQPYRLLFCAVYPTSGRISNG